MKTQTAVAFLVKDIIKVEMQDLEEFLTKKNITIIKKNNRHITIETEELQKVKDILIEYIQKRVSKDGKNHLKELYKESGCKLLSDFINNKTLDIFFDITDEDRYVVIERQ